MPRKPRNANQSWRQIAQEELAGRKSGLAAFDEIIRRYDEMKREVDAKVKLLDKFRRQVLIPLARKEGFRKGGSVMLAGFTNSALIERVADVLITDQAAAANLPAPVRRYLCVQLFKPNARLKELVRTGGATGLRPDFIADRIAQRFIQRGVKTRRHWRVSRISVRPAPSAVKSSRRKAA